MMQKSFLAFLVLLFGAGFIMLSGASTVQAQPSIQVSTDKSSYTLGQDTMNFSVSLENSGESTTIDIHVAILSPLGVIYEYPDWNTTISPSYKNVNLTAGANRQMGKELSVQVSGDRPPFLLPGNYSLVAATTEAGTFNFIGNVAVSSFTVNDASSKSATLKIQPGTKIVGTQETGISHLAVRQNAKIYAEGTKSSPILMTGTRERSTEEWGGLVLNGRAPINRAATSAKGEADTGLYGGNNPDDSSGLLRYVVVAHAGYAFDPETELNGIAFQGVGRGTVVDHIQVHQNKDDGVEFFGGTADVKHVYLTENEDDSLDWTDGWQGKAQFVSVIKNQASGDQGIEADNLEADNQAQPRSEPTIANLAMQGFAGNGQGMRLRRGTGVHIFNAICKGFGEGQIDVDSSETFANAPSSIMPTELTIRNSMISGSQLFVEEGDPFLVSDWYHGQSNQVQDPQVDGLNKLTANSPAYLKSGKSTAIINDSFFDQVDYVGAFDPNKTDTWEKGWTIAPGQNSENAGIWNSAVVDTTSSCPANVGGLSVTDNGDGTCTIAAGDMTEDATLTNNKIWKLGGPIFVGAAQ